MVDYKQLHARYKEEYASMAETIEAGIEKNRKGNAVFSFRNENGQPIVGARVKVRQKDHSFKFGCNALMLGQCGEKNKEYETLLSRLFNLVTTTVCWNVYEFPEGVFHFEDKGECAYRRPPIDRVRDFAKRNGMAFKGQPLVADSWFPKSWASRDPETLKKQYENYFRKIAERYGEDLAIIDVVNEAYYCKGRTPDFPLYTPDLSFRLWAFECAKKIFPPNVILNYNEGTQENSYMGAEHYYNDVKMLLESGCGMQSCSFQYHILPSFNNYRGNDDGDFINHLRGDYLSLHEIYDTYMKFSTLGIPLYISEVTMASRAEGLPIELGEEIQRDALEYLYRLWFSIPKMQGVIYWNLVDGHAWYRETECLGCPVDINFCEKPSYARLYQMIHREWKTNLDLETDENGEVSLRGFGGDYALTLEREGEESVRLTATIEEQKENEKVFTL